MELKHGTDKLEGGLLAHYEQMFADLQDQEIKYLEVGIQRGGSIEWATKFFKKGIVFGMDREIRPEAEDLMDVASLIVVDQNDKEGMHIYADRFKEFDIIVDDGCHYHDLTKGTFDTLWPFVKQGGWYIIEDWTAGYSTLDKYHGMVELICYILTHKNKYNFGDIKINSDMKSFAAFRKL